MRILLGPGRARSAGLLGVLGGLAAALAAAALVNAAVAQHSSPEARGIFEVSHLPPLLTLPGEAVDPVYDVHCVAASQADPEQGCDASGTVFARAGERGAFTPFALHGRSSDGVRQLWTAIPDGLASSRSGLEYYAVLESGSGDRLLVPAGGAEAPHRALRLDEPIAVELGAYVFGSARRAGVRVAEAPWGDGPHDAGLEPGRGLAPVGASSFDVERDGTVVVLDQVHRRALRWQAASRIAATMPLSISGRLADMSIGDDGSIYVLESVREPERNPVIRHFDANGRDLDVIEAAERSPSQIRTGHDGPVVLEHPSHEWMPVAVGGFPLSPKQQLRAGRLGRPLRDGREVVVLRQGNELRAALVGPRGVQRSWRVSSQTPLAEVQLAEPLGQRLVVVVRVYSDDADEFAVLVLDGDGVAQRFALEAADWAETAPLSRFRLAGTSLYRLGSSRSGVFVDCFDLKER